MWQFTIVLLVLFVISPGVVHPVAHDRRLIVAPRLSRGHHTELHDPDRHRHRRDARRPSCGPRRTHQRPRHPARLGAVDRDRIAERGQPWFRGPTVRRGRGRRTLVRLPADRQDPGRSRPGRAALRRTRTQRAGRPLVPDLAERWSVDASGKTWTVDLRADARWHDGTPVTPDDVIFTIETLQDPAYTGPSATSWSELTVATTGPRQVRFTLKTPLGGFIQADPADRPGPPAWGRADRIPRRRPVRRATGRFGTVRRDRPHPKVCLARPRGDRPGNRRPEPHGRLVPGSLTTPAPTLRPSRPLPYLAGIELRFYTDVDALVRDFRAGDLDGASGLPPADAVELGSMDGARPSGIPDRPSPPSC